MKWKPKPYQERALEFMLANPRCQLWLDKGLGKTSIVLHGIQELRPEVLRVLVVSTRRITKSVWPAEVEKWNLDIPIRDIEGTPKARLRMLREPWEGVETITFEKLRWLLREFGEFPWGMVVFDESSKLKEPGTRRFRTLRRHVRELPARVVHMTGSPAPAGLLNLWGPAFVLDAGERLGKRYTDYKARWFEVDPANFWRLTPRAGASEQVQGKLRDITLSLRAQDYLELPPLLVNDVRVELPARARSIYQELERDMLAELEHGTVVAANGGVLTGKCRQLANGAMYHADQSWEVLHDEKLEALDEVIEEAEGENIIVAYQFRSDLARLQERYRKAAVLDHERVVDEWNRGEHSLLLLHPASAGHGLNLQGGGRIMVMMGAPWSLDLYEQCIDRIAGGLRREKATFVHRILSAGTVDEDVVRALEQHRTVQEMLKERMRCAA